MVTENDVLEFFQKELSVPVTWGFKKIPLQLDTVLQDWAVSILACQSPRVFRVVGVCIFGVY